MLDKYPKPISRLRRYDLTVSNQSGNSGEALKRVVFLSKRYIKSDDYLYSYDCVCTPTFQRLMFIQIGLSHKSEDRK